MFHLRQKELQRGEADARRILRANDYYWKAASLRPSMREKWYHDLKRRLDRYDVRWLVSEIRRSHGYSPSDLKKITGAELPGMGISSSIPSLIRRYALLEGGLLRQMRLETDDARAEGWLKIELALTLLHLNYKNAPPRKSGHLALSHPLRAGLFASVIGRETDLVVTSLLHDLVEEHLEGKISFFCPSPPLGAKPRAGDAEYKTADEIFLHLGRLFGKDVEANLRLLTRSAERGGRHGWEAEYRAYLKRAYSRLGSAIAKGIDAIINLWELDPIRDRQEREEMIRNTILKASWQMWHWHMISWRIHDVLASALEEYARGDEYDKLRSELRAISRKWVRSFFRGYSIAGKHAYSLELLAKTRASGMPVLAIYDHGAENGRRMLVVEFPFIYEEAVAAEILAEALSSLSMQALSARKWRSLLPENLASAAFLMVELEEAQLAKAGGLESFCRALVPPYDAALAATGTIPGFDRKRMAVEAALGPYFRAMR